MKDPFLCRRKRANQPKKLTLVCSFNGKFQPRPPSGNLWYTGGDTRIVSRLKSKVSELLVLCPNNGGASFSLRYRLPVDDEDAPLVLITADDDVWCMIDDYDALESYGKPTRLWIFVCNRSGYPNRQHTVNNMRVNCVEPENLNGGFGVSCGNSNGFGGDTEGTCGNSNGLESRNSMSHWCGGEFDNAKVKNSATGVNGVLKQQLLAKQSAQIRSFQSVSGLAVEQTEKEFTSENQKYDQPVADLTSEPQGPVSHETTDMKFGSNPNRENLMPWSANFDSVKSHFAPLSCSNQLIGSGRVWDGLHSGISNHRTCSYNIRNHRNSLTEMGNHRNVRLEGRPWVGKFYPGLRSSSNISKPGQAMRLSHPSLWKLSYGYHHRTLEGIGRMMDSGLNYRAYSFDQPCSSKENFTDKGDHGVPQRQMSYPNEFHFACNRSYAGLGEIVNLIKNPLTSIRAVDAQEDLLIGSNGKRCEVPCQAPCKNLHGTPRSSKPICCDFETESQLMEPVQAIDISGSQNNLGSINGTEVGCSGELHHRSAHAVQGGLASSVDLSLWNLSLSSSKEVEPPDHSSPTSNDVSKALRIPQSKPLDLMDEEHLSSGPQVRTSNAVACDSTSQNAAKLEKVDEQKEEMQQVHSCISSIGEKDDIKEHKFSMANGGIPSDLGAVYTHLESRGLQTIKSSDLEYIKELGSGAYGTVFYGKWKGCDVAIKKLKLSCFTEGAPGQDKVLADFWMEAHILEQLHHPRIIAFYGVVTDGPITNLATVTEYMVNGSLKQVLRKKDRTIDRRKRLIIAMDVASGMEYLHEKNIVHFDLKSHNLLVNMKDPMQPVCKIGDLGLSKIKQKKLVSGGVRGTIPWMAPELLSSKKNMVTEKVDVYSFGIVMWELLTGEEPYGKMRSEEIIGGIIKGNLRPEIPSWCDPAWRSLMERCWSSDPDSRPAFLEIVKELRAMAAAMNIK